MLVASLRMVRVGARLVTLPLLHSTSPHKGYGERVPCPGRADDFYCNLTMRHCVNRMKMSQ